MSDVTFTYEQYHHGCDAIRNERNRVQDQLDEAIEIISGLVILERGSGERAFAFLERHNAAVSSPSSPEK